MKKTIDFIAEYQKELQEFQQSKGKEPTNLEWERFNLTSALVDAQESQFKKSKSQEKIYQLEHIFYPCLCDIAKTQGGRVELEIDDETFFAQLVYQAMMRTGRLHPSLKCRLPFCRGQVLDR